MAVAVVDAPTSLPDTGPLLAIDWGEKRIGVALSDPEQRVAHPLTVLTRRRGRRFPLRELKAVLDAHPSVGIVVGLPLEASGLEGPTARAVRTDAAHVADKTGLPIVYVDERMTTARVEAERRATGAKRRGPVDALAATVLLQGFLDGRSA